MTDHRTEAEIKAYNLHCALQSLLHHYKYIVDKTNSEPLFESDSDPDKVAGRALYDNMPLADWEPPCRSRRSAQLPDIGVNSSDVFLQFRREHGMLLEIGRPHHVTDLRFLLAQSAADAAGLGAVAGGMEGNGLQERAANALKGGAAGALVGGALPLAARGISAAASPLVSNIRARINPEGFAQSQIARGIHESGANPDQISLDTVQAANEGQPQFTVADAMGNPGQRLLSTVARAPGDGRTAAVNALEARQAGQGRRISNALAEGFDSPQTAAQTEAGLTAARGADADTAYGQVRAGSNPVDVVGTINHLDRVIGTQPGQITTPANDSIEAALTPFRQRLGRVMQALGLLAQIGIPIAGLGSESTGQSQGTQQMSGAQQFATIAGGIGSMIPKNPLTFNFGG